MAEDPKAVAVGEKLWRYWDQSILVSTMGSYPITGLCSKRSPWSSTTTLAGGASGGASWQFQEPYRRPKDFGHDGHNTAINPASVQRQFISCFSHGLLLVIGLHQVHHTFSACAGDLVDQQSLSASCFCFFSFLPSVLPSLLPSSIPSFLDLCFFLDASPYSLPFAPASCSSSITIFDSHSTPTLLTSTTTSAGAASGGAAWQFQEPDRRRKDFGHEDGHDTGVNPASVRRQLIPCLCSFFWSTESLGICMNHVPLQPQDVWSFFFRIVKIYIIIPKYKLNVELGNPPGKVKGD